MKLIPRISPGSGNLRKHIRHSFKQIIHLIYSSMTAKMYKNKIVPASRKPILSQRLKFY
jgi:hypothetical protein